MPEHEKISGGHLGFRKPWADTIGIPSAPQAHSGCHPGWTGSLGELFGMIYKVVPEGDSFQQSPLLQGSGSAAIPLVCDVM